MPPTVAPHPSSADLTAFALGKLPPALSETVGRHLDTCPQCRTIADKAPPDAFVGLLQEANLRSPVPAALASTPSLQASPTHGPRSPTPSINPADMPAGLRDHSRYRVIRLLGQGGMGAVYQAEHKVMKRTVAIKVISSALVDHVEAVERFRFEINAAAKLDHPNIVKAYDAEQVGDLHMLVLEYVEGRDLAAVIEKKGPLPLAHACQFIRLAALGLQHAHERGMVHRDLKPHNLMLTPKGQVKILDFGLAKLVSERKHKAGLTPANIVMGTPEFLAPEQAQDTKAADIRADIYSLGCTLFYLLTGRPPFVGETAMQLVLAHLQEPPPPLDSLRPDAPAQLSDLLNKMLAKDPAKRQQTPKEVAEALLPFAKPGAHPAPASPANQAVPWAMIVENEAPFSGLASQPAPRLPARRNRWRIPALIAGGLMLIAAFLWAQGLFVEVKTKHGTVKLKNLPPDAKVTVNGEKVTVTADEANTFTVTVAADRTITVQITKAGFAPQEEKVKVAPGRSQNIEVNLQSESVVTKHDSKGGLPEVVVEPARSANGFVPIFNGKDLTGWTIFPDGTGNWKVVDNAITCSGPGSYLFFRQRQYRDFRLRAEIAINPKGNSGIYFRSQFSSRGYPNGYELEIIDAAGAWGSLLFSTNNLVHVLAKGLDSLDGRGEWTTHEVTAVGDQITTTVNGKQVNQIHNATYAQLHGFIALQHFNAATQVRYRKIEIQDLSTAKFTPYDSKEVRQNIVGSTWLWGNGGNQISFNDNNTGAETEASGRPASTFTWSINADGVIETIHSNGYTATAWPEPDKNALQVEVRAPSGAGQQIRATRVEPRKNLPTPPTPIPAARDPAPKESKGAAAKAPPASAARDGMRDAGQDTQDRTPAPDVETAIHPAPRQYVALFNRRNSSGWSFGHPVGSAKVVNNVSVLNGTLMVTGAAVAGQGFAWLKTDRNDFSDFHLKLRVCNVDNKGRKVWFRATHAADGLNSGYTVTIGGRDPSADDKTWNLGSIGKAKNRSFGPDASLLAAAAAHVPIGIGKWYDVEVSAVGNRITTAINGKQVAEYVDDDTSISSGGIWLVSSATLTTPFRAIEIAEGDATPDPGKPLQNPPPGPPPTAPPFVPLFNGKDLTGWKQIAGNQGDWTVKNGVLLGTVKSGISALDSTRLDYGDFVLRLEMRRDNDTCCQIHFRQRIVGPTRQNYAVMTGGKRVNNSLSNTGQIFSVTAGADSLLGQPSELANSSAGIIPIGRWFVMEIEAVDNRFRILLDGRQVTNAVDATNLSPSGYFRLRVRDGGSLSFRKIEVKELSERTANEKEELFRKTLENLRTDLRARQQEYLANVGGSLPNNRGPIYNKRPSKHMADIADRIDEVLADKQSSVSARAIVVVERLNEAFGTGANCITAAHIRADFASLLDDQKKQYKRNLEALSGKRVLAP